jgi:hypothetical protein
LGFEQLKKQWERAGALSSDDDSAFKQWSGDDLRRMVVDANLVAQEAAFSAILCYVTECGSLAVRYCLHLLIIVSYYS